MTTSHELTVRYAPSDTTLEHWEIRAMHNGDVIGRVRLRQMPECKCMAFIFGVTVAEGHRREGIARAMLERALTIARDNDMILIQATVQVENAASRGLMESCGFFSACRVTNPNTKHELLLYVKRMLPKSDSTDQES